MLASLLSALGIPSSLITAIVGLPFTVIIAIILGMILIKFIIIPSVSRAISEIFNKYFSTGDKLLTKLDEISNKLDGNNSRLDKLEQLIEDITSDNIGATDIDLAISTFAYAVNNTHLRLLMFFNTRLRVNHFIGSEAIIATRYNTKSSELSSKLFAQLSKYHINGVALSSYFVNGGVESYLKHLSAEFYDLQRLKAEGDELVKTITEEDIQNGLDRLLSIQMGLFKQWCLSLNNVDTYINKKSNIKVQIISEANDLEEL